MTCAGFSRLVAKLTGRKAAQLKDVYLQAFYDAEEKLQIEKAAQQPDSAEPKIENPVTKRLFDLQMEHEKFRDEISKAGQDATCDVSELLEDIEKAYLLRHRALKQLLMMQAEREAHLLAVDYIHGV